MTQKHTLDFNTRAKALESKVRDAREYLGIPGKIIPKKDAVSLLESVLRPGDRVIIEGNNQKQAQFLAKAMAGLDPAKVNSLHMMQSSVTLDDHLEVFRRGIASKLDFAFSGPQAKPLAELALAGKVKIGAIHTYPELYSRYLLDLPPDAALVCAEEADQDGNLYLGHNSEDTPFIAEATNGCKGIVVAQVERMVARVTRVDIPGDQVQFVVPTDEPTRIDALFTRDPARMTRDQILQAMLTIKGIYAPYGVQTLNHGIGYATAAIELLLPTYGQQLGLKGSIASHWILNPHPTLIPAIEAGFVKSVYSFGSEPGMDEYIKARSDIFYTCGSGILRSSRPFAHMAGHYGIDLFIGATLQIDGDGNSSTATRGRISGFGGAPNLGCSAPGRRHKSAAWERAGREAAAGQPESPLTRGRKLVVQLANTVVPGKNIPIFVEELDAVSMCGQGIFDAPPVMIYADEVTHIATEVGIAHLCRCRTIEERRAAIRAVAGDTPIGRKAVASETDTLRTRSIVQLPEDLAIKRDDAVPSLLAAADLTDLQAQSGGLYSPSI